MRNKRKQKIKYKKERVILSDILPYELPITFSNRFFYEFVLENNINFDEGNLYWNKKDDLLDAIIITLFGADPDSAIETRSKKYFDKDIAENSFKKKSKKLPISFTSIPFSYLISHKQDEYRELKICHPRNQVQIVDFYHKNKELILYHCKRSEFSIRRPSKLSKFVFHKDKTHYDKLTEEDISVEEFDKEYENLRSFFVYKNYSNIYQFYESYPFHRYEKKYNKLIKLDISKCFDSIYTHSLSWALLSKDSVKENLDESKKTFGGKFDSLMQNLNYNETNGIIIGPEFSRIFAELILQSVDRDVLQILKDEHGYKHKTDYEISRYVDDYFIFYNDEMVKESILQTLKLKLKEYKLYLNSQKAIVYDKPIITEISMAKHHVANLIDDNIKYKIEEKEKKEVDSSGKENLTKVRHGSINIDSNKLITKFKTVLKEYGVEYKDLLNYSLAVIERKSKKIIKDYHSIEKVDNSERQLIKAILEALDFTFFIYSVSPKVNTTIKLCRILRVYNSFIKRKGGNIDYKHLVYKVIYDNIYFILKKNKNSNHTQVETLYLLIALSELGKEYWLDLDALCSYFNIELESNNYLQQNLNYLSIVVLLFYIKNKKKYEKLKKYIENFIVFKFQNKISFLRKDTELILLLFDTISCPYISTDIKKKLLTIYNVECSSQEKFINYRPYWFTKWTDFNFGKELDAKHSQEVY